MPKRNSKVCPTFFTCVWFLLTLDRSQVFLLSLGRTFGCEKQLKPTPFVIKFKNHAQDLAQVIFNDSFSGNQELVSLVNNVGSIFYFFLWHVFLICKTKWNMHDKNNEWHKTFYREISFTWLFFKYCQEPYLEPNQKSMVEPFSKNS